MYIYMHELRNIAAGLLLLVALVAVVAAAATTAARVRGEAA